ncbi:MAG: molecular chaperone TorD family protein [Nitrospinae bacterium]|nr:molecular chaperone TorD family protein [Nitrospinota bacterium]
MGPRQTLYLGLSLAFRPPTPGHVEGGQDNELLRMVAEAAAVLGGAALRERLDCVGDYLECLEQRDVAEALVELEAEYNRLFVGPMPPLAHPYESVYRSAEALVMGDCALDVLRVYAQAGVVLSAGYKDLPDHVAVELEYMALLCQRAEVARAAGLATVVDALRQAAWTFLEHHLRRWLPQFCRRVLLGATSPYYRQWALLADLFTRAEVCRMRSEKEVRA